MSVGCWRSISEHEKALWRDACLVVSGVALIGLAAIVLPHLALFSSSPDWGIYSGAAQRWLASGAYFEPRQLAGPYPVLEGDVLYPPATLWLFVPFSFLPRLFWLGVPLAIMAAALWRLRPALWGWSAILVLLCISPVALMELTSGNPLLWFMAALFASVAWNSPASLILLKPTLLPFAMIGIWRRSWWLGLGLLALLSLPMIALDLTWLRVVLDAQQPKGLLYSLHEYPYMLVPLVAWVSSRSRNWSFRLHRPGWAESSDSRCRPSGLRSRPE